MEQVHLFSNIATSKTILYLVRRKANSVMIRTVITSIIVAAIAMICSSCSRDDRFLPVYRGQETHAVFYISVAKNTKSGAETQTTYYTENEYGSIDSDQPIGILGLSNTCGVVIDDMPVYEKDGVRTASLLLPNHTEQSIGLTAFYPYVRDVSYYKDGSYVISFTPDDIAKGPLATDAVTVMCDDESEAVNLEFHHIANSIGFRVCDITREEGLKGHIHIRKVVLHGMSVEGLFVTDGENSKWMTQGKRSALVFFDGNSRVECGKGNAMYIAGSTLSESKEECKRFYVVPEELEEGKHFVEVVIDVDGFDYGGVHYPAMAGKSLNIPLWNVIPENTFEIGLQYTFTFGINLAQVFDKIEFSASVDDWTKNFTSRILDYDNE